MLLTILGIVDVVIGKENSISLSPNSSRHQTKHKMMVSLLHMYIGLCMSSNLLLLEWWWWWWFECFTETKYRGEKLSILTQSSPNRYYSCISTCIASTKPRVYTERYIYIYIYRYGLDNDLILYFIKLCIAERKGLEESLCGETLR